MEEEVLDHDRPLIGGQLGIRRVLAKVGPTSNSDHHLSNNAVKSRSEVNVVEALRESGRLARWQTTI